MNRPLAATAAVIVALPLAWLAGEQHRSNCIAEGRAGCSVLPWSGGHRPDSLQGLSPAERRIVQRELDDAAR